MLFDKFVPYLFDRQTYSDIFVNTARKRRKKGDCILELLCNQYNTILEISFDMVEYTKQYDRD